MYKTAFGERPPVVDEVLPSTTLPGGQVLLRSQVRDDTVIDRVWAVVYPPSFVEPTPTADGVIPKLNLPEVTLSDSDGDGIYVGVYENFTEQGEYRLVVYAEDGEGNLSQPRTLTVDTSGYKVYLPVVVKN